MKKNPTQTLRILLNLLKRLHNLKETIPNDLRKILITKIITTLNNKITKTIAIRIIAIIKIITITIKPFHRIIHFTNLLKKRRFLFTDQSILMIA